MIGQNILFVGCGGSSSLLLSKIKHKIGPKRANENNIHFLSLDLVPHDPIRLHNIKEEDGEYFFFGNVNPRAYVTEIIREGINSVDYQQLNEYFPISLGDQFLRTLPNRRIDNGAGRNRMVGRLMFFNKRESARNLIQTKLNLLNDKVKNANLRVVVISSCCGGTGSSIFYDVLNMAAAKSIDLYPIVIGPSLLVEVNRRILKELADKLMMNAFAFFEELNFYVNHEHLNFSFFSNSNTSLAIPFVVFFDNKLGETSRVANSIGEFNDYLSDTIFEMFLGVENSAFGEQNIWASVENIKQDILEEIRKVESAADAELLEKKNMVSFSFFKQPANSEHLKETLELIKGLDGTLKQSQIATKEDILAAFNSDQPEHRRADFRTLLTYSEEAIKQTFIEPFAKQDYQNVAKFNRIEKTVTLETINDYLIKIYEMLREVSGDYETGNEDDEGESGDQDNDEKSIFRRVIDGLFGGSGTDDDDDDDELD